MMYVVMQELHPKYAFPLRLQFRLGRTLIRACMYVNDAHFRTTKHKRYVQSKGWRWYDYSILISAHPSQPPDTKRECRGR